MFRLTPVVRITLALVLITTTLVLSADMLRLIPDPSRVIFDARKKVCESLAVFGTLSMEKNDIESLQTTMQVFVYRNPDVRYATLRQSDGTILAKAGYLAQSPVESQMDKGPANIVSVPIFKENQRWATVEIHFKPLYRQGLIGIWERPVVKLSAFFISLGFFLYLFFMRKILRYLDPSTAIPARVKAALDTLAEGVVVLDSKERIVLANAAFAEKVGQSANSLLGQRVSSLNWTLPNSSEPPDDYPWLEAMREGHPCTGFQLVLHTKNKGGLTFVVNGAPISDGGKKSRGALATFDDVTQIEQQNEKLQKMLVMLKESRTKVEIQNRKLQILATQDPMTRCLNRRSFFKAFEAEFSRARRYGHSLSCAMVDIDHFKSINDRYGHLTGDQVLQKVAQTLRSVLRKSDIICRYGGEEFCILLPHIGVENSVKASERFRKAIESADCKGISVTASFGVSSLEFGGEGPQELLDQADKALYAAKNSGRNRVVRWDHVNCESSEAAVELAPNPTVFGTDAANHTHSTAVSIPA